MKLSLVSEDLMKEFLDRFNDLSVTKTPFHQRQMDNILKILFNEISSANRYIQNLKLLDKINSHFVEIKSDKNAPITQLFNSHFVIESVREYVKKYLKGYLIFETFINNHHIKNVFCYSTSG